ncbi:MAG TPA: hypothetical protein VD794_09815 [Flavisolibacter sp.]|nr:hypothetical protein [Flavisolibacter sp.]
MIPCNELRIGNYVLINDHTRKIAMISGVEDHKHLPTVGYYVGEDLRFINCDSKQLQAVSLSSKELEKSGFSFDNYFKLWQKPRQSAGTGMEMELDSDNNVVELDSDYNVVDFLRRPILKEVKSMHCLQNLYYALLGKELALVPVQAVTY